MVLAMRICAKIVEYNTSVPMLPSVNIRVPFIDIRRINGSNLQRRRPSVTRFDRCIIPVKGYTAIGAVEVSYGTKTS